MGMPIGSTSWRTFLQRTTRYTSFAVRLSSVVFRAAIWRKTGFFPTWLLSFGQIPAVTFRRADREVLDQGVRWRRVILLKEVSFRTCFPVEGHGSAWFSDIPRKYPIFFLVSRCPISLYLFNSVGPFQWGEAGNAHCHAARTSHPGV
jgi:hypothetical protein